MDFLSPIHKKYSEWFSLEPGELVHDNCGTYMLTDRFDYVVSSQDVILGVYPVKNSAMRAAQEFCSDGNFKVDVYRHEYYNNNLVEAELIFEGGLNEEGEMEHA